VGVGRFRGVESGDLREELCEQIGAADLLVQQTQRL
jgi:hypothetical protein